MRFHSRSAKPMASGLTLVEILVALVIGLTLTAGIATVFIANKQTYRFQDALARLQENGRFALAIMERDIRRAGYTGFENLVLKANTVKKSKTDSTGCPSLNLSFDLGAPLDGFDNVSSGFLGLNPPVVPDTDVLRVLVGKDVGAKVQKQPGQDDEGPGSASLQVSAYANLREGQIALVVDQFGEEGSIFQISQFQNKSPHHTEVVHNKGADDPGNCVKSLGRSYEGGGYLVILERSIYYICQTARGVPALCRSLNGGTGEELVEGVEDMQIWYGEDETPADGNDVITRYVTAARSPIWDNVRSARINLLLQSTDPQALNALQPAIKFPVPYAQLGDLKVASSNLWDDVPSQNSSNADRRWRQVYSTTATVRNRVP